MSPSGSRSAGGPRPKSGRASPNYWNCCISITSPTGFPHNWRAVEPKVLLLDEPLGALDAKARKDLRNWLRRLHDEVHVTTVFVTHTRKRR